jgi:hypothetical protein
MSTVQPSKRVAVSRSPLHDPSILQSIFSYVGPGHWLFLATVSSLWRELYSAVGSLILPGRAFFSRKITCVPKMTLYSSVFASASRVRLAHDCSLDSNNLQYAYAAGACADIATLVTAPQLGAPWSPYTLRGAAAVGSVLKLQWLHTQQHCQLPADIGKYAAWGGSIEVLMWLKRLDIAFSQEMCATAARYNQLVALQFLHSEGCALDTKLCNIAAQYGNNDILRWLTHQGMSLTTETCITAIRYDQLATLQFLLAEGCVLDVALVCHAAKDSSIDVLLWLGQQGVVKIAEACEYAARGNLLYHLQLLHADGWPWNERVCSAAASYGFFDLLRWAHEHGCPWDADTIAREAAKSGNVALMAWVKQQPGVLFDHKCMISAEAYDDLDMCYYLFEEGCSWPPDDDYKASTLSRAAGEHGNVNELDNLLEINCPLDFDALCEEAATYGNLDILQYVQQLGQFIPKNLSFGLLWAGFYEHLETAKWLRQQGVPWPRVLGVPDCNSAEIEKWAPAMIAWARSEGYTSAIHESDDDDSESDRDEDADN